MSTTADFINKIDRGLVVHYPDGKKKGTRVDPMELAWCMEDILEALRSIDDRLTKLEKEKSR